MSCFQRFSDTFDRILDKVATTIYSKGSLKFFIVLYWLYKICCNFISSSGGSGSSRETSSALILPAIVVIASICGLLLDTHILLIPFFLAATYEMTLAVCKEAILLTYVIEPSSTVDPTKTEIPLLEIMFKGIVDEAKGSVELPFIREGIILLVAFAAILVTGYQMSEMAKRERRLEQQERELVAYHPNVRNMRFIFPLDDDQIVGPHTALSPPTYSMAIRNEGVRTYAPELCITEDTAPPSYRTLERVPLNPQSTRQDPPTYTTDHSTVSRQSSTISIEM